MIMMLGACQEKETEKPKPAAAVPREVRVIHPLNGAVTRYITVPAEVRPLREATLYAKVTGYLKSVGADKGDEVKEGSLLAEIEVPELIADAAKYKAELELADLEFQRVSDARKQAPDLVVALNVDTARSKAAVAKANLERAETLLGFTRVIAPFTGIVTRRNLDPGAFVPAATSGSPQNAALLTIADFKTVRIQAAVPEAEAALVRQGQPVKVTVEGLRGRVFEGTVTRFAYSLNELTKTMLAEIELPNPDLELRPGMYASARLGVEARTNALLVPAEAVVTEKANSFVFVGIEGVAKKTPVKVGFADGVNVEVMSGVTRDQGVLVPVKGALAEGLAIRPVEGK